MANGTAALSGSGQLQALFPVALLSGVGQLGTVPVALAPYSVAGGSASVASLTVTVGTGITGATGTNAGDAIVVGVLTNSVAGLPVGVSDSQGNTYTLATLDTNRFPICAGYVAQNTRALAANTDTITAKFAALSGIKAMIARGCSGVLPGAALDQAVAGDGLSASPSLPTAGLTQAAEWAVAILASGTAGGTPTSWTGGFTAVSTQAAGPFLTLADQVTTAAGALTAGASITSATWTMGVVTLRSLVTVAAVQGASAKLSGSGTLTAAPAVSAPALLSGQGTLTALAAILPPSLMSGAGTLAAVGNVTALVTLSGYGTLTTVGVAVYYPGGGTHTVTGPAQAATVTTTETGSATVSEAETGTAAVV